MEVYPLFKTKGDQIMMKVGISYVSMEQAELNLQTELNHWDFDAVVRDSKNQWNDYLSRIEIKETPRTNKPDFTLIYGIRTRSKDHQ